MSLRIDQIEKLIADNSFKLEETIFDELSLEERNIIFECSRNFGFDIKKEDKFFLESFKSHWPNEPKAIVYIKGKYIVSSSLLLENEKIDLIIVHSEVQKERYRAIVAQLIKKKLVTLYADCDSEWLYEVLIDTADVYLMEKLKKMDKRIPIYSVVFEDNGNFKVEEQGIV